MKQDRHWVVLKFGGTSVSSDENWENILQIIRSRQQQGYSICIVHSALKGVSRLLNQMILESEESRVLKLVEEIKQQHLEFAATLGLEGNTLLDPYFKQLEELASGLMDKTTVDARTEAELLSLGELMATTLGSEFLKQNELDVSWKDARKCLKSVPQESVSKRQSVLNAICGEEEDEDLKKEFSEENSIILTQGFIAGDNEEKTVLLGWEGSDASAANFAAKLNAERLEIWTDVPGLFSADPRRIDSARLLENLSYEEALEMATNGAGVLHPRCINPVRRHQIPIYVNYTPQPDLPGTVISNRVSDGESVLKAVTLRDQVTLVSMETLGMWEEIGFLADAFSVFRQFELSIDLVSTSESNVTISLDNMLNLHFEQIREEFINELSKYCKVEIIDSVSAVSILGKNIQSILHQVGGLFQIFSDYDVYMVSQASNNLNVTFVVRSNLAEQLARQLHKQIITESSNQSSLGKSWSELMKPGSEQTDDRIYWWKEERDKLQALGREKRSAYVYSQEEIDCNIRELRQLKAIDRYFYAMKANSNPGVMQQFYDSGLGFECASIEEVQRVFELFPEIEPHRILFTPNFVPRREYELATDYGVYITLDNSYPLREWPRVFEGQSIILRIDPGRGCGHHKHVKTGGNYSKFGIPQEELSETTRLIDKVQAKVIGLHAHTGSGIKDESQWKEMAVFLNDVAQNFENVKFLDLGGGIGIPENETDNRVDLGKANRLLEDFKSEHPEYELWVEPGRFLIASAGVLLTTVTQLKGKGETGYVGVETGMNSLIRPALYGANHTIVNLSKLDQPDQKLVNLVGPICETGDKLGVNRHFPDSETGDIILIANAGAYGYVMSSNYNLRPPAEEVYLDV